MIDLTVTNEVPKEKTSVAMGLFDGLHYGHRTVIQYAAEIAAHHTDISSAVFTFDTESVTSKGTDGVECILSRNLKFRLIEELGVHFIYSPVFSDFRNLSGSEFVKLILCDRLNAKYINCGEDFRFGKGAECGVAELEILCRKYGMTLHVVPAVKNHSGDRISSTMIRELIKEGKIDTANNLLVKPFTLMLPVSHGKQLGRVLDFPTINQHLPPRQLAPKYGVYASKTEVHGKIYKSITNIGIKPTVQANAPLAETYIMDYNGSELYGEVINVSLTAFIRPEIKFDSIEKLKEQIARDIESILSVAEEAYHFVPTNEI